MRLRLAVTGLVLAVVLAACSGGPASSTATGPSTSPASASPSPSVDTVELTIYGAASLKGALERVEAAYESALPGTTLTISTDSSAALETQIEQGAPADVFLSADTTNAQKLVDAGLAEEAAVTFAENELTIIVPADNPAGITTPADLAKSGIRIIAAGDEVPITKYALELVENLAGEAGYSTDFVAAYAANVVSREDNVKAVVAKIEFGEGDAGIVYVTDAVASSWVAKVEVPPSANVRATYDGVVIKGSKNVQAAKEFLEWLAGPDGQAILRELGFVPAS